jgi:hypothetical protein
MLGDVCRTPVPPWQRDGSGNSFRCHIPAAELAFLQDAAPAADRETAEGAGVGQG